MTKLKSIALELLQKYEESETSLIWEYSGDIDKSEKYLAVEVAKYRELIDKYAEQEPCNDAVSRQAVLDDVNKKFNEINIILENLSSVQPKPKMGHCKDCKYFEYDKKFDAIPLILVHEICNKWGDGCKTSVDGYCYLFEPQERGE